MLYPSRMTTNAEQLRWCIQYYRAAADVESDPQWRAAWRDAVARAQRLIQEGTMTDETETMSVYDYRTGELLEGSPTLALVEASLAAGPEGVVAGWYYEGEWALVEEGAGRSVYVR